MNKPWVKSTSAWWRCPLHYAGRPRHQNSTKRGQYQTCTQTSENADVGDPDKTDQVTKQTAHQIVIAPSPAYSNRFMRINYQMIQKKTLIMRNQPYSTGCWVNSHKRSLTVQSRHIDLKVKAVQLEVGNGDVGSIIEVLNCVGKVQRETKAR
ncbi:hypothetical protein PGT21_000692 [Puccinia graminis f. sp. tritici]|uniref:Uncharacterized protein n=1 Tax=Puccinia graminis f. sp. tritici TaxID=56615 RepID=A0A5B0QHV0_PUCGR|nr:hypothetical protein PGT21_000692 [Puccinia graminis f. sp. tritici]